MVLLVQYRGTATLKGAFGVCVRVCASVCKCVQCALLWKVIIMLDRASQQRWKMLNISWYICTSLTGHHAVSMCMLNQHQQNRRLSPAPAVIVRRARRPLDVAAGLYLLREDGILWVGWRDQPSIDDAQGSRSQAGGKVATEAQVALQAQ